MYKEPHLQQKSDECAALWHEWFKAEYTDKDKEKGRELRKKWSKCCGELGKMIGQEVKTNSEYKNMKSEWK